MIGKQLGSYSILSELGMGGMGTVYLARGEGGERVAIKVVHPHLIATPGFFKRFLREAELGKQVRHENVVRTLDVDATMLDGKQANYMVMEYVEGRSLRDLLNDLGSIPETLLREIALQIAGGVAAIHKEGIVHRDLKPENVLITGDHRVRIMDLGVAKLQEASVALTKEGQFAGSFLYAAPEQFGAGNVGTAADLYSLGVILYELATGTNPFKHDDVAAVISAHLNTVPAPAADRSPDLSPFFSEVIRVLITKQVAERFPSGEALHALLKQGERSEWWAKRERALRQGDKKLPQLRVPRDTTLHGRAAELDLLGTAWAEAKSGDGCTILVEGEAGIGKTRLVDQFLRSLQGEEIHVLYGSYPPSGGLGGLSEAILGKFGESELAQALTPYLTVTPSLIPAFAALLKHEAPPTGAEALHCYALHAVICHLMRALAAERPTVWVIDDLHFAPADSRGLVLAMARAVASQRLLLVLTSRPGLPEEELSHLTRLPSVRRLTLGRLGARDVIELLRDAFKSESIAAKLGGTIAYKSDGVPFFVLEMVRALKEGSLLRQQPDGSYIQTAVITDIQVPSAVKDLIEARLMDLTKEERAILDLGAVQGFEFDPDLVARVRGLKRIHVLETLADLERRSGVVRGGSGVCRFDQYQIQEILLGKIMPDLRAEYHTLLAEAYEEREGLGADASGQDAHFMALHHLEGSRPRAAKRYFAAALQSLEGGYRNDAAIQLANQALARDLFKGTERVDLLLRKATRLDLLGRRDEQRAALEEALRNAEQESVLGAKVRCALGWHYANVAEFKRASDSFDEALRLTQDAGDRKLEAQVHSDFTAVRWYLGENESAEQGLRRSIAISQELGDRRAEIAARGRLAVVVWYLGRFEDALGEIDQCITVGREMGERLVEAVALVNRGPIHALLGRACEARDALTESQRILRSIGAQRPDSYASHRLGSVAEQEGDLDEAERRYGEALALRRQIRFAIGETETLVALGRLHLKQGRRADAQKILEEAAESSAKIDAPEGIVHAAAYLATLSGDATAAGKLLEKYRSRLGVPALMEAAFILWQVTQDRRYLAEAHDRLQFLRDHAPEACRESMVQEVPLHRAIAAARAR